MSCPWLASECHQSRATPACSLWTWWHCLSHHRWLHLSCIWAWPLQQTGIDQTGATASFLATFGGRQSASSQHKTCAGPGLLSRNVLTTTFVTLLCQREPCLGFPSRCDYNRCVTNVVSHEDMDHTDLVNCGDTVLPDVHFLYLSANLNNSSKMAQYNHKTLFIS